MRKLLIFTMLTVMVAAPQAFGQACGQGYYEIELNTEKDVHYTLFAVTPKGMIYSDQNNKTLVGERFFPRQTKADWFWNPPLKVDAKVAEQFVTNYVARNYEPIFRDLASAGSSDKGTIRFTTAEAYSAPFLLRLTSPGFYDTYYLGAFLGGCKSSIKIVLRSVR